VYIVNIFDVMREDFWPSVPSDIPNMHWRFGFSVLDWGGKTILDFLAPRRADDYSGKEVFLLPFNFRRSLLEQFAVDRLLSTFQHLQGMHPGRFKNFNIHLRFLENISTENERYFPWDVLLHVIIDGITCYLPINVSFFHTIMSSIWSESEDEDFEIKRQLLEKQLVDILFPIEGPDTGIYGVCFPEQFAHGKTSKIFEGFPSSSQTSSSDTHEKFRPIKKDIIVNGMPYVMYFFMGVGLRGNRARFIEMIGSQAIMDYCIEMASAWEHNFQISQEHEEDLELYTRTKHMLMGKMGALQ
jgi:hypothetical protein